MIVNCLACQNPFNKLPNQIRKHPNHFCSRSCAAKHNNRGRRRGPFTFRVCVKCSASFPYEPDHRNRKRCPDCRVVMLGSEYYRQTTLADAWKLPSLKNKHPSWRNSYVRLLNRLWNASLLQQPCAVCGYSQHVELCHIKSIRSFPETATIGEVNDPSNVIQLCPNHHWELDNGRLDDKLIETFSRSQ